MKHSTVKPLNTVFFRGQRNGTVFGVLVLGVLQDTGKKGERMVARFSGGHGIRGVLTK